MNTPALADDATSESSQIERRSSEAPKKLDQSLCAEFPADLCLRAAWAATMLFPHVHLREELLARQKEYEEKSWFGKGIHDIWHWSPKPYSSNILDQPRERLERFAHTGLQRDLVGHEPSGELNDQITLQLQQDVVKELYGDNIDAFLDEHIPYVVTQLANEKGAAEASSQVPWYAKAALLAPQVLESISLWVGAARLPAFRG